MSEKTLLDCKLCGGHAELTVAADYQGWMEEDRAVICGNCNIELNALDYEGDVVDAWNRLMEK